MPCRLPASFLSLLFPLLLWLAAPPLAYGQAVGQVQGTAQLQDQGKPPPAAIAPPVGAAAARLLRDVLRDDARRAELIAALDALVAGGATAAVGPDSPPTPQAAPDTPGGRWLQGSADLLHAVGVQVEQTYFAITDLRWLAQWLLSLVSEPTLREGLVDALARLAVVLAVGLGLAWLVRCAVTPAGAALRARAPSTAVELAVEDALARAEHGATEAGPPPQAAPGWARRLVLALGCLGLDLLAILAFLVGAHLVLASPVADTRLTQLTILAVVHAIALWRAALGLTHMLVAPAAPRLRLLPVSDDTAIYVLRWTRRISGILLLGWGTLQAATVLGLPQPAHAGWVKLLSLVTVIALVVVVIQRRAAVSAAIAGASAASATATHGESRAGALARLRAWLAPIWHWLAIFYILALWLTWMAEQGGAQTDLVGRLIAATALLLGGRLGAALINRWLTRKLHLGPALAEPYPGLVGRLRGYLPLLRIVVATIFAIAVLLGLCALWGLVPARFLLATPVGRSFVSGLFSIGLTLLLALVVWEAVNLGIARQLARLSAAAQLARSARLRTLLPMLRMALLVSIAAMAGLTALSQIGINIAPLLAGAGVIGIAIGFGSQKLVQDVITGLFLLLENTIQVGEVVNLAGVSGVVEELTIRSIRLRSEDGSIHVIPFSAVSTVTNMTRDYSRAVIEVPVAYKDDYDRVVDVMRDIAAGMRAEPAWETEILDDLEVWGLVRFDASCIVIKCRIKCLPFARWRVQREFHRRMKLRFAAEGIEFPSPHQKLVWDGPSPLMPPTA